MLPLAEEARDSPFFGKDSIAAGLLALSVFGIALLWGSLTEYNEGRNAASEAVRQGRVTTILHAQNDSTGYPSAPLPFNTIVFPEGEVLMDSGVTSNGEIWTKTSSSSGTTILRIYLPNGLCVSSIEFAKAKN